MLAGPSIAPGDLALRHDIQRLDDYGVLSGPVTTWPLSWGPILSDLQIHRPTAELPTDVTDSLARCPGQGEMTRPSPLPAAQATISIRTGK